MWHKQTADAPLTLYWDLPHCQIPNNSRAGSASVHFAIIAKYGTCVGISTDPTKEVFALIRNPVSRYQSAKAKAVDDPLLGNHFGRQIDLLKGVVHLYKFPEHLSEFANDTGLGSMGWVNKSHHKDALTSEELAVVEMAYREDIRVFESINRPGMRYEP